MVLRLLPVVRIGGICGTSCGPVFGRMGNGLNRFGLVVIGNNFWLPSTLGGHASPKYAKKLTLAFASVAASGSAKGKHLDLLLFLWW